MYKVKIATFFFVCIFDRFTNFLCNFLFLKINYALFLLGIISDFCLTIISKTWIICSDLKYKIMTLKKLIIENIFSIIMIAL